MSLVLLRRTRSNVGVALMLTLIWTVTLTTIAIAAPINGTGTFKPTSGACRGQRPFTDRFIFEVSGNQLTITQPSTKDVATGTLNPDGTFHISGKSEDYTGKVTGTDIQATYIQTDDACRATYDASFKLDAPLALPTPAAGSNSLASAGGSAGGPTGPPGIPGAGEQSRFPFGPAAGGATVLVGAAAVYFVFRRRRVQSGEIVELVTLESAMAADALARDMLGGSNTRIDPPSHTMESDTVAPDAFRPSNVDFSGIVVDPPTPTRGAGTGTAGPAGPADEDREITDALRTSEAQGSIFEPPQGPGQKR